MEIYHVTLGPFHCSGIVTLPCISLNLPRFWTCSSLFWSYAAHRLFYTRALYIFEDSYVLLVVCFIPG